MLVGGFRATGRTFLGSTGRLLSGGEILGQDYVAGLEISPQNFG